MLINCIISHNTRAATWASRPANVESNRNPYCKPRLILSIIRLILFEYHWRRKNENRSPSFRSTLPGRRPRRWRLGSRFTLHGACQSRLRQMPHQTFLGHCSGRRSTQNKRILPGLPHRTSSSRQTSDPEMQHVPLRQAALQARGMHVMPQKPA